MSLTRKSLFTTTMLAGAALVAMPAFAQETVPAATAQAQAQPPATEVGEVVVTGSRIRNKEFTSASPVQVLSRDESDQRGVPDLAQTLLQSTLAIASFQLNDQLTGYVTAGGGGTQSVALRGAGPQRTLTLLNGRRAGPAGTRGQVQAFDLGVIPQSIVERTEILKDGASSIYGSDAVAGVINIITRTDLDGGEMNAFYSQPLESGGEQLRLDAAFGKTFERGYANLSMEYSKTSALLRKDREGTACASDYLFDPVSGERIDYVDPTTGRYKCYNLNSNYVALLGTPMNLVRTVPGYNYPTAAQGNNSAFAGWERFNRAGYPDTYLYTPSDNEYVQNSTVISPAERYSAYFAGGYKLTENVELYTELLYSHRESSQRGVGQVFQSFAQRNIVNGAPNNLPASNPNNPFGQAVQTVGIYESSSFQELDYYRGVIGLRGSVGKWDWDVYGQYSFSDGLYNNGPRIMLDRFVALSSPNVACTDTPLGGNFSNFTCADLPNGIDWTSERILTGNFNEAERSFLFVEEDHTTTYDHGYIEAVISNSEVFALPAGDVGAAFGAQIRKESLDDLPGYQARNRNIALYSSAGQTKGEDTVREIFGEFEVPILRDAPFAHNVSANVSGRYSDYDSYGDSTTYKASLNWAFSPAIRLRTSYGTSFRAPALYEQFLGAQVGYSSQALDPCYNYVDNDTISPTILAACIADGASPTTGGSSVAVATVGGRDLLEAETAKSLNVGLIWTPGFTGLNVSLDYWEFEISDAVSRLGGSEIIERCYEGQVGYCDLFTRVRNPGGTDDGKLATVNDAYVNVSEQNYRGLDLGLRWSGETRLGRLTIGSQNSYKLEDTETYEGETTSYLGGTFNQNGPRYSGTVSFNLDNGRFGYYYGISIIGQGSDYGYQGGDVFANSKYADLLNGIGSADCEAAGNYCVRYKFRTEASYIHSMSVRYRGEGWSATLGMQNVFDQAPPNVSTANFRTGVSALNAYDMRGRRISIRFGKSF